MGPGTVWRSCREVRLGGPDLGEHKARGLAQDPTVGSPWGPLSWCSSRECSGKSRWSRAASLGAPQEF